MGYTRNIIKGLSFIGSLRFATKVIGFLEAIILARILAPSQFGAYGVALIALGLLEVLTETGVNIFLVQEDTIDEYISSAWTVSIVRGFLIASILFITAPFIANFFHSAQALLLLQLISLVPLARGFINPSIVKFQKELLFAKDFSYQFTILLVDTITSIGVCYFTKSPIGIVIGLLTGVLVELILSFLVVKPRPGLDIKKDYISKIFHRGKWITASTIFDYLFENADNIIVGRLLGTAALGIYQLAYALSVVVLAEVGKVFVYVTTPVMVKISHDTPHLRSVFFKTILSVLLLITPLALILILFPTIFVWILGPKWVGLLSVLPILALLGFVRSITGTSSALFLSVRKQGFVTVITMTTIFGLLVSIIPLVNHYGIVGAGFAGLIGSLLAVPVLVYFIWKVFHHRKI